ncbi:hypothetical protein HPB47_023978 [Ixodes persulcatus]|uniref:Uncharacterized protein n=1 Tax=Ixodes persulcatus TaxID=34615 RepID=A0AC60Q5J5_IXOPE|nr:hypothetical protein HPB47_023978 [Ixodes persulcatus]
MFVEVGAEYVHRGSWSSPTSAVAEKTVMGRGQQPVLLKTEVDLPVEGEDASSLEAHQQWLCAESESWCLTKAAD